MQSLSLLQFFFFLTIMNSRFFGQNLNINLKNVRAKKMLKDNPYEFWKFVKNKHASNNILKVMTKGNDQGKCIPMTLFYLNKK